MITEIYDRLYDFTELVLDDDNISIDIVSEVKAPRSTKPFVTIEIGDFRQLHHQMKLELTDDGVERVLLVKTFKVTFKAYTDVVGGAEDILTIIHNHLVTDYSLDYFGDNLGYRRTLMGVQKISTALDDINENRAVLQVEFGTVQTIDRQVGLIEHIHVRDELFDNDIIIDK